MSITKAERARRRGVPQTETAALLKEVAELRKQVAVQNREAQVRDYDDLAKRMKTGETVTIPQGEPLAGHTFEKLANGKLKVIGTRTIAGKPIIDKDPRNQRWVAE